MAISVFDLFKIGIGPSRSLGPVSRHDNYKETSRGGLAVSAVEC